MCVTVPRYRPEFWGGSPRYLFACVWFVFSQMEFDEKDLRREISYAIKNIHGVRQVPRGEAPCSLHLHGSTLGPVSPPEPLGTPNVRTEAGVGRCPVTRSPSKPPGTEGRPESAAQKAHSRASIPGHQELCIPPTPPHSRQCPSGDRKSVV